MSVVVRILLGVTLLLIGVAGASAGPTLLLIAAGALCLVCLAFPDSAWRIG